MLLKVIDTVAFFPSTVNPFSIDIGFAVEPVLAKSRLLSVIILALTAFIAAFNVVFLVYFKDVKFAVTTL